MFPCIGQFVLQAAWHSGGPAWRAGVLLRIRPRHIRGIRLCARPDTSDSDYRCDVSGHALVFICAGVCAACLLPLLLVLSGHHISAGRVGDCRALFAGAVEVGDPKEVTLSAMRILVIEDEKKTAAFLAKGLREAGFAVDLARDGEVGLDQARATKFDLLVVDIMLPHKDGWEVVEELRRDGVRTPILFLTACDGVRDRVKGLELGADDYLVKPFAFSELLARVRSVLRRAPQRQAEHVRIADLDMDMRHHRATRSGVSLNLTPKEFLLLAHLVRSAGEMVSRAEIAEHVWDIGFKTETNVVDVVVRRLRAKVDDPFKTKLIHTIRGVGYVLKAQ